MCLCLCGKGYGFISNDLHHTERKTPAVFKATQPGTWYRLGEADNIASCFTLSTLMDFFYVMTSEGARVRSPCQQYRRHRGMIAGSCENVRCRACSQGFCSTHYRLLWNARRMLRTSTAIARRPWFIHSTPWVLRRRHVSRKLNLLGRTLYNFF